MSGPDQPFLPEGDVFTVQGWRSYVNQEPPVKPLRLSMDEYQALDDAARAAYNERRRIYVMRLGVLPTPDLERIHDRFWAQFQSNLCLPGHVVKVGAVLDGDAGMGKTTIARTFAREVER